MMTSNIKSNDVDDTLQRSLIEELRLLRMDTRRLNSSFVEHLKPFQKKDGSFKTTPDSLDLPKAPNTPPGTPDISVGSTCTVLMAALGAGREKERKELFDNTHIRELFRKSVEGSRWGSSGLDDGNAFTTAMMVRCAGFIVKNKIMNAQEVAGLKHGRFEPNEDVADRTLGEIVQLKANKGETSFRVIDYPPKTTHAYWFVDGVIEMQLDLPKSDWEKIASWASREFHRQLIYVSAGNDALMDPPSLAMAACLIQRIRRMIDENPKLAEISRELPSIVELQFGIEQVFSMQSDSGIWHKYFPLFHFPKGQGAADYCFSFEFLEAILVEFGTAVLRDSQLLQRVKRSVRWCDTHELLYTDSATKKVYRGWNAGGEVGKLAAGKSESWATATVHMFLTQLDRRIGDLLDELVLKQFAVDRRAVTNSPKSFDGLINIPLTFSNENPTTLKDVVENELLTNAKNLDPEELLNRGLPVPRSALLFGPPGTSKSRLAKAIAEYLGWPLIIITPSEFLGRGLEQVHAQVDERFRDLMDLRMTVVFFDEMDALAQTREGDELKDSSKRSISRILQFLQQARGTARAGDLDVTRQLLTTSMLPKLSGLWNQKRVIFLMATNHKQHLDPAITRPNRFDLLLCVAPPSWKSKCSTENVSIILPIDRELQDADSERSKQIKEQTVKELLRLVPDGSATEKRLDLFTVSELGIFLDHLRRRKGQLLDGLKQFDISEFERLVNDWAATNITLRTESATLAEFEEDKKASRRQYYPGQE